MRLKIVNVGELVLRQRARPLAAEEILSAEIQQLIADMRQTMHEAPGVGLAAPQIGQGLQLAVIEDKAEYLTGLTADQIAERDRRPVPFHVIVNPQITKVEPGAPSGAEGVFFEGCLSLPGFTALVPRALSVRVECLDHKARPTILNAEGWYARILQHEVDHLQGTLYIDRMQSRSFSTLDNFQQYWKAKGRKEIYGELGA